MSSNSLDASTKTLERPSRMARDDWKQAGRCLAFEVATACGIHAMRAVEATLRDWHKLVRTGVAYATDWQNSIGAIKKENENEGDSDIKPRVELAWAR